MAIEMSNIVRSAQRIKETGGGGPPPGSIQPPPPPRYNGPPPDYRSRSAHNGPPAVGSYGPGGYEDPYNRPPPRSNYNLY
jgi:hypothetical protein